ncbi:MAG: peptidoglycan-binding domain-containing protein, partial [Bacillota bacterium]
PIYGGMLEFNQVSGYLGSYQAFLNYYDDLEEGSALRTDGYFDLATKTALENFQFEQSLVVSGMLDRETSIVIHQLYMQRVQDLTYDIQLQNLIDIIKS